MAVFRHARRLLTSQSAPLGRVGWAIVLVGLTLAAGLLGFSYRSVATFERDLPLARVTDDIALSIWQARDGVFEVLGGDTKIDVDADVLAWLDDGAARCRGLIAGGQTPEGYLPPLSQRSDRDIAESLCRDIDAYRVLTLGVLENPAANGEGTASDIRLDRLFTQIIATTETLSRSLDATIDNDVNRLRNLGISMAVVSIVIALAVALIVDRHRRQLAEQKAALADLGAIVASTGDAVMAMDLVGTVTSWNPGAEALYGYSASEILGVNGARLGAPEYQEQFGGTWLSIIEHKSVHTYEALGLRRDGSEVPIAVTLSPVLDQGRIRGVSAIARDITERVAKDAELAVARNEALEASRLKSQFLATMSHEIRTPLNGVIGLNGLLLETSLNETQRQYAEGVHGAGEALLAVINDILDFSKLEAGKVDLELAGFDPRLLVEEVAALVAVPAHSKGLELLASCSSDVPSALIGDVGRIRQILLNLAGNAVKFTAAGEVIVQACMVPGDAGGPEVRFEVVDTGIGLAEGGQERLFEMFSQADASTTRRFGGTGLGLAISQRLVDAMKGQIGVDSVLGEGSTFWCTLPLPTAARAEVPPSLPSHHLLPGLRVLVVDDNRTNRSILLRQLTGWQMVPDAVADAPTALAALRAAAAGGQPYDIAVLDLLMPDMDGLELAGLMHADPTLQRTRKIMLTSSAHVDPDDLVAVGISQWCTKPVRASVLYGRLMRLVADDKTICSGSQPVGETAVLHRAGRILIVEDNAVNQLVAEGIAVMLGYSVDIVADGTQALAALDRGRYAAVLMDCHMPVMDGFEATRAIRRAEGRTGGRMPVIAMTAAALDGDRERCLAAGMDAYVSKPVSIGELDDALSRWAVVAPDDAAMPNPADSSGAPATQWIEVPR